MATKISEKPWSDFSEADYTLAQWAAACLVKPAGEVTAKSQCKLPVRTPDGVLNRAGVHAAAAALAGARGGVDISPAQRSAALKQVASLYRSLNEQLPASVEHSAVDAFKKTLGLNSLAHIAMPTEKDETNTTAVIVALPGETDQIRLVGDQDKHATLLFFGETSTLPADAKSTMVKALSQVADLSHPFYEDIVGIQRLGSDIPPALVAMLSKRSLGTVRDMLMIDSAITGYLDNTAQYPNYTAHTTLAYPDYSGEDPLRKLMQGIYQIGFNRLALWWNDEKFVFDLARDDNSEADLEMSEELTSFLAHVGVKGMNNVLTDRFMVHADDTVESVYKSMTSVQADTANLIFGSIATGDQDLTGDYVVSGTQTLTDVLNSMTSVQKSVLLFIAGGIEPQVQHDELSTEFLEHFGVKGMKWGVRKDQSSGSTKNTADIRSTSALGRAVAKDKIIRGKGTLGDAHVAALKSTGRRSANFFLGDKTYWKRAGLIAGTAALAVGALVALPGSVPVGALAYTVGAYQTASYANGISNALRAVRGNSRIAKSYQNLGPQIRKAQTAGSHKVNNILSKSGHVSKQQLSVKHSDELADFLAHYGTKGMKWGVRKESGGGGSTAVKGLKLAGKGAKGVGKGLEETGKFTGHLAAKGVGKLRNNRAEKKIMDNQEVSKEAAKFIREHQGKGSQMSDQELRDMIGRANLLTQYDALFAPKSTANAELRAKVETLQLEAQAKQAKSTISQARVQKVNSLVKTSENAFEAYSKLNKATGGSLNQIISKELNISMASATGGRRSKVGSHMLGVPVKK